jgi:ribosomal-protein-alanine N-acetyltransferase
MRGWPVTLTEPHLLQRPVTLRPVRVSDARLWREIRVRNAPWLRPWEPTNPETPLYRSSLGPYIAMVRAMRREARQGQAIPWVVTYGGEFVGQLTVGSITWGSARSGQVGYWIDEAFAGLGIIPTTLAMAVDHCFGVIGLHRLEASIRPENHASRRVVEKLGFREEGIRVRQLHINGAWRDHVCYALTAEEVPQGLMPRWRSIQMASRPTASLLFPATHRPGYSCKPRSAITLRHMSAPGAGHAEGRIVEQRDTLRRHRRHLGWRAHPQVASAGFGG